MIGHSFNCADSRRIPHEYGNVASSLPLRKVTIKSLHTNSEYAQTPKTSVDFSVAFAYDRMMKRIAVIGAGISGLSAAYRLAQIAPKAVVHTYDRRNRVGGVLTTMNRNGFQIEQSADNFITTVPWGVKLCKELGLGDHLVQTNPNYRRTYVVRKGRLHLLPDGFLMLAPTKLWPMATTPILSPFGKLRAGFELFVPSRKNDGDESMADFIRRRLGREVFERLVEPLVSGVYAADMEKLSVMATLPRFREMERDHGSLIRAMQKQLAANRSANLSEQSGARYSMFVTLRNGLSSLCDALAARLPEDSLKLGCDVSILKKTGESWTVNDSRYDAVILATETHAAAKLLAASHLELSEKLAAVPHEGTAIATFAFDTVQLKQVVRGMGFVVPKIEKSPILAGSFSSFKYEHRAPDGNILIRVFAGGARAPEFAEMPEERLVPILLAELKRVVRIDGDPLFSTVAHWPRTMPQYHVGHRELIRDIETLCAADPTLALAGNSFHGVGIPNCIKSGFDAAEKWHAH